MQITEACDKFYKLAKEKGVKTTLPHNTQRYEGGAGSRTDKETYTLNLSNFVVKATNETFNDWGPSVESYGEMQYIEIAVSENIVFSAARKIRHSINRYDYETGKPIEKERKEPEKTWKIANGEIPASLFVTAET